MPGLCVDPTFSVCGAVKYGIVKHEEHIVGSDVNIYKEHVSGLHRLESGFEKLNLRTGLDPVCAGYAGLNEGCTGILGCCLEAQQTRGNQGRKKGGGRRGEMGEAGK